MDYKLCKDCKGFCCDDIGLYKAPHELQNAYHEWINSDDKKGRSSELISMSHEKDSRPQRLVDIWVIYPMLIFLHQDVTHPDGEIDCSNQEGSKAVYHYSCKHHNKKTGECNIYEERPMLCRTYPDNGYCGYKKVKAFRPKWFKPGMSYKSWHEGLYPEEKKKKKYRNKKIINSNPTEVKSEDKA